MTIRQRRAREQSANGLRCTHFASRVQLTPTAAATNRHELLDCLSRSDMLWRARRNAAAERRYDGTITARALSLENTNAWAKAVVMFRESLAAGSTHVMAIVSPVRGMAVHATTTGLWQRPSSRM